MESLETIIGQLPFFEGLAPQHLATITGCASNVRFAADTIVARAGGPADTFWVVREGRLAVELFVPGRGAVTIETAGENEVVGFSWLQPPYQLHFDVRALAMTRALAFDGRCLRGKCAGDPAFGYEILGRFSRVMVSRIRSMSLQLLDIYGEHPVDSE